MRFTTKGKFKKKHIYMKTLYVLYNAWGITEVFKI